MSKEDLLIPYGNYQHELGLQCLSRTSAEACVQASTTVRFRLEHGMLGIPIYEGHPDDARFYGRPGHDSRQVFGRVRDLRADLNGLYARVLISDAGRTIIQEKDYAYLSPRWKMRRLTKTSFEPVMILSFGLTNVPVIDACLIPSQYRTRPALVQA